MILSNLKNAVGAFFRVTDLSTFTVNGYDLFLNAYNNTIEQAQNLHNFELSRVLATLNIDGETGGRLSDATFDGFKGQLVASGTVTPDFTGTWTPGPVYQNEPSFTKVNTDGDTYARLVWNGAMWTVYDDSSNVLWQGSTDEGMIAGVYTPGVGITGNLTFTYDTGPFSGIKEVIAVQRTNADGVLIPLDLTRPDIASERDRYQDELSENYATYNRYPSDADLLNLAENGTLILRGSTIYIYPVSPITSSPITVFLEAYGLLRPAVIADLDSTDPLNFLLEHGGQWLQWSIICELNYYFKTFVSRVEGNLAPPEAARDTAWRNLLLWDTYMVDSHITRSR